MKYEKVIKRETMIISLSVIIMVLIIIGSSYALFMQVNTSSNMQIVNSGTLSVTYQAGTIMTSTLVPQDDFDGLATAGYSFSVTDTGTLDCAYDIEIYNDPDNNSNAIPQQYLKVSLDGGTPVLLTSLAKSAATSGETIENNIKYVVKSDGLVMASGKAGDVVTHNIKLWIDEDAPTSVIGKTVAIEITVNGEVAELTLAQTIIANGGGKSAIEAKTTPDFTIAAPVPSSYKDGGFNSNESTYSISTEDQGYYVTYADSYSLNTTTGEYSLTNPTKALYSTVYSSLAGKYIASYSDDWISASFVSDATLNSSVPQAIFKVKTAAYDAANSADIVFYTLKYTKEWNKEIVNTYDATSSGIWSMNDDYGTSYYFRGNADNNVIFGKWQVDQYVGFDSTDRYDFNYYSSLNSCTSATSNNVDCQKIISAGDDMCWRILRVNGNGTIRMIYSGTANNGICNNSLLENMAIGSTNYNTATNDNAYVGYMFGAIGASTYTATHANTNSSIIKTIIDGWYNVNLASVNDKINDTEFCADRSLASGTGIGSVSSQYAGYSRKTTTHVPSLICTNKNDRFTVTDTTTGNGNLTYPVGLITMDEIALAGSSITYGTSNPSTFLYTYDKSFWTITPNSGGSDTTVYLGGYEGNIGYSRVNVNYGIRPVINLNAGTLILAGDGTTNKPYIVK